MILALIKSNEEQRTVVRSTDTRVVCQGQQGIYFIFTFPELKTVTDCVNDTTLLATACAIGF